MTRTVEFFYDFTSPTAYLAWARLPEIAKRTGATIAYRPMFLGGVMQATGNRPPGTLPQKGAWMAADLQRWSRRFNTPYKPNPHFPMMTLMVQRAAHGWIDRPDFDAYLAAIFHAAWRDQKNIADKAVLTEILTTAGFSPEEFFAAAAKPSPAASSARPPSSSAMKCTSARTGWISLRRRWREPERARCRCPHPPSC
jgi:2-hydroxychromene-2-carboxylate isomerase